MYHMTYRSSYLPLRRTSRADESRSPSVAIKVDTRANLKPLYVPARISSRAESTTAAR